MKYLSLILVLMLFACGDEVTNTENVTMNYDSPLGLGISEEPRAKNGWSASGELIQKNSTKTVRLQADFAMPGNYTVQFAVNPITYDTLLSAIIEAEVTWSVEGNHITRRITVQNGASISGVGQGVMVKVRDVSVDDIPGDPNKYGVTITVAPGLRPSTQVPPTLRLGSGTIAGAGASIDKAIPAEAGAQSVQVVWASHTGLSIPANSVYAQQLDAGGDVLKAWYVNAAEWVPLEPNASTIRVISTVADPVRVNVCLGIDG